jgi:hypothetical protein
MTEQNPISETENLVGQMMEIIDPGVLVSKFLVIVEGVDSDGQRAMYSTVSRGLTSWDVLGMLAFVEAREQALMTVRRMEDPDDSSQD